MLQVSRWKFVILMCMFRLSLLALVFRESIVLWRGLLVMKQLSYVFISLELSFRMMVPVVVNIVFLGERRK